MTLLRRLGAEGTLGSIVIFLKFSTTDDSTVVIFPERDSTAATW